MFFIKRKRTVIAYLKLYASLANFIIYTPAFYTFIKAVR